VLPQQLFEDLLAAVQHVLHRCKQYELCRFLSVSR
jgi:hypothetical protein